MPSNYAKEKKSIRARVLRYIKEVSTGKVSVGRYERLAVERYLQDKEEIDFSEDHAFAAIIFIEVLVKHSTGKWTGKAFKLSDWQLFICWNIFGFRNGEFRRFQKVYMTVARKNGKSTFVAAILIYCFLADSPREHRPEGYCVATKREQAKLVYSEACRMIKASKELQDLVFSYHTHIYKKDDEGTLKALGSNSNESGWNPSIVIKDELHGWKYYHRELYDEMSTGGASRQQPLEIIITTAGDETSEIWIEEDEYATRVLEGVSLKERVDDRYFAFICRLDGPSTCVECNGDGCKKCNQKGYLEGDDVFDKANWRKANPNLGISVSEDYISKQANEAEHKPTALNSFKRYHANIKTSSNEKLIDVEAWKFCVFDRPELQQVNLAFGGIDLGRTWDFSAWALVIPIEEDKFRIVSKTYTCEARDEGLRTPQVKNWIAQGYLEEHPGDAVNYSKIEEDILAAHDQYEVMNWAYDSKFANHMAQRIINELGEDAVYKFIQSAGYYNEPIREFRKYLNQKRIYHEGNPCVSWQAGNLTVSRNARDEWMPDKGSSTAKIDAMVAIIMAFGGVLFHQVENHEVNYYADRPLEIV